ncbi:MAG: ROK family protein [Bacillales bacterium]
MEKVYIGIDVGGMSIKGGLVDEKGQIIDKKVVKTNSSEGASKFLNDLVDLISTLIDSCDKEIYSIQSIGLGIPGVVNSYKCTIDYACNLNLFNIDLKEVLKKFNLPIYVSNDANVACLAEQKLGIAKGYNNVVMITIGTGIGGGVVINNQLYEGNEGKGCELGHMVLHLNGKECGCGRKGCFESYASASALVDLTIKYMNQDKESKMWEYCENDISNVNGLTSFECAKQGDKTANDLLNEYTFYLGEGLLNICNIFRPQAIVIGGGVSNQKEYFIDKIVNYLEDNNYGYKNTPKVVILPATLGNDAGIIGASLLGK